MAGEEENSAITIATGRTIEITKKIKIQTDGPSSDWACFHPYERNNAPFDHRHPKQTGWF